MNFFQNKNKGHNKVTSILKKFAFLRSFKVLTDYQFEYKGENIKIDNILVGFFGIIILTDLDYAGEIYIESEKSTEWLNINNSKKLKFSSPLNQSTNYENAIKTILRQEKILNVQIENLIVFTNNNIELYKPNKSPVIIMKDLSKLLHLPKYEIDNEYDVEKIVEILGKASKKQ